VYLALISSASSAAVPSAPDTHPVFLIKLSLPLLKFAFIFWYRNYLSEDFIKRDVGGGQENEIPVHNNCIGEKEVFENL
jgi:hypothetical protein